MTAPEGIRGVSIFEPSRSLWTDRMLSVLRIMVGALYLTHGLQKLFGIPSGVTPGPVSNLLTQRGLAGILETFGGAAILIGLGTRPIAFLLAGEMAVAYFQVHVPRSFLPILNGGDNVVLFCFIFLYFVFAGGGSLAVDHAIAARRPAGAQSGSSSMLRGSVRGRAFRS
jgi:putative oxidoreductase